MVSILTTPRIETDKSKETGRVIQRTKIYGRRTTMKGLNVGPRSVEGS